MRKSVVFVFCFLVASVCLLSTSRVTAQDTKLGNEKLWDEIWKSVRADKERIEKSNTASTEKGQSDELPKPRADWLKVLQRHLDVLPSHATTAKPLIRTDNVASSGVRSGKDFDFKMVFRFLKESGITLTNDQWMTLFRKFVLSDKNTKSTTAATTFSTPSLKGETTVALTASKEPNKKVHEEDWLMELSNRLRTKPEGHKDQNMAKTTKPSPTPGSTMAPKRVENAKLDDISDEQWVHLLEQMMAGNDVKKSSPTPGSTTAPTRVENAELDDISDEQWVHVLEQMMAGNDVKTNVESSQSTTPSSTRPQPSPSSESLPQTSTSESSGLDEIKDTSSMSNQQWEALLEQHFQENYHTKDAKSGTTRTPELLIGNKDVTKEKVVIPDEKWDQALQDILDKRSRPEQEYNTAFGSQTTPSTSTVKTSKSLTNVDVSGTDLSDTEWEHLLQEALDVNRVQQDAKINTKSTYRTPLKTSEFNEAKVSEEDTNKDWKRTLQENLDLSSRVKSDKVEGAKSATSVMPITTERSSRSNDDESSGRIEDLQWIHLLERVLNINENHIDDGHDDLSDRQWMQLLERVMKSDLSFEAKTNLEQIIREQSSEPTRVPTVESVQEKSLNQDEGNVLSDSDWNDVLQNAIDKDVQDLLAPVSRIGSKPRTQNPTTPIMVTQRDNVAMSNDNTADEMWEQLLNVKARVNQEIDSTVWPTGSTEKNGNIKAQTPRALPSVDKVKTNAGDDHSVDLLILFSVGCGVLLICLVVAVAVVMCHKKRMLCFASMEKQHTTVLNSDLNRWDPQTLRPSKENMNAFLYSIPTPLKEIKIDY